jgi:hypothetical protein
MVGRRRTAPVLLSSLTGCALLLALLTACGGEHEPSTSLSAPTQTEREAVATGHLLIVGGPFPGSPRPLGFGSVSFSGAAQITVRVGQDGSFSASLPQGTYAVVGRSKEFGSGAYPCHASRPIQVLSEEATRIDVYCNAR